MYSHNYITTSLANCTAGQSYGLAPSAFTLEPTPCQRVDPPLQPQHLRGKPVWGRGLPEQGLRGLQRGSRGPQGRPALLFPGGLVTGSLRGRLANERNISNAMVPVLKIKSFPYGLGQSLTEQT